MKKNLTLVAEVLIYLIIGSALSFPSTLPRANDGNGLDSQQKAQFMDALDSWRKKCGIPGMSVAVVRKQAVVLAQGFGFADVENGIPATENTPYNIASCTKPIAAVILMKLVEAGKLDLDDAMRDLLKDTVFPFRYRGESCRGYAATFKKIGQIINDSSSPLAPQLRGSYKDYRHDTERITIRHHLTHTS